MLTRRGLLKFSAAGMVMTMLPRTAMAGPVTVGGGARKLVVVNLRGALDGLSAVPAVGDPQFAQVRGKLVIDNPLPLTSLFALHPKLSYLHELYGRRELVVFHAFASPYRARSHFSGQDALANGTATTLIHTGWLNRALYVGRGAGDKAPGDKAHGMSVGAVAPLLLRGPAPVSSWAPRLGREPNALVLDALNRLYASNSNFANIWKEGNAIRGIADASNIKADAKHKKGLPLLFNMAGQFLKSPDMQTAVVEVSGWDSHVSQQRRLNVLLEQFDLGLRELESSLGPLWGSTAVVVMTEFGRTVRINGTSGTDHGTGAAAFLFGGAVQGGRVIADWRGLAPAELYEGRDIFPTGDLRSIFKGVLGDHMGLSVSHLEDVVFPDSQKTLPLTGLLRA